jgi:hypothetical protein
MEWRNQVNVTLPTDQWATGAEPDSSLANTLITLVQTAG